MGKNNGQLEIKLLATLKGSTTQSKGSCRNPRTRRQLLFPRESGLLDLESAKVRKSLRDYVDVVLVLAQKDFEVRHRNSVLGFLWSLLNPLPYMIILSLVFSYLLRVSVPNYAAWVLVVYRCCLLETNPSVSRLCGASMRESTSIVPIYRREKATRYWSHIPRRIARRFSDIYQAMLSVVWGVSALR
jgi:hypothetical protein